MARSQYINTFNTTADYNNYIDSAFPKFPNVALDKEENKLKIRSQSPNNYQIWGTTTLTSNFNVKINNQNVEVTVDTNLGEYYLTGWTGTVIDLTGFMYNYSASPYLTTIKKIDFDTSNLTTLTQTFLECSAVTYLDLSNFNTSQVTNTVQCFRNMGSLRTLDLSGWDLSSVTNHNDMFSSTPLTDIYITVEATLNLLTNNLSSAGNAYIPSTATIHYNNFDYKWQNNAWTLQS